MIEAKQGQNAMILDIPNAFVQTTIPQGEKDEKIIMKIRGVFVDLLLEIDPGYTKTMLYMKITQRFYMYS